MKNKLIFLLALSFFMMPSLLYAGYQAEFTPAISVSELYDDNIDLDYKDKKTDWITTVSPSLNLNLISEKNNILLRYSPSFVRYKNEEQNNTTRHSGTLGFNQNFTSRLSFNVNDTLIKTEDPIEETQGIYGVRRTRNIYTRNSAVAGITYLFGRENSLNLGYNYSLLRNDDAALLDNAGLFDNTSYYPSAGLTYWLNINNGVEISYQGLLIDYSRGEDEIIQDSISGDTAGIKYLHRFSTRSTASIDYTYNSRYTGDVKDYDIHEANIGLEHSFSNDLSLSLSGGYFLLKDEVSGDDNGYSYDVSISKEFSRGNISFGGNGGYSESFLEAERQGFSKYRMLNTSFDYQLFEMLSNHGRLSYRYDKNEQNYKYTICSAGYGLTLSFLRWFALAIDYSRSTRKDDIETNEYNDNRVMMTLSASKLFR